MFVHTVAGRGDNVHVGSSWEYNLGRFRLALRCCNFGRLLEMSRRYVSSRSLMAIKLTCSSLDIPGRMCRNLAVETCIAACLYQSLTTIYSLLGAFQIERHVSRVTFDNGSLGLADDMPDRPWKVGIVSHR